MERQSISYRTFFPQHLWHLRDNDPDAYKSVVDWIEQYFVLGEVASVTPEPGGETTFSIYPRDEKGERYGQYVPSNSPRGRDHGVTLVKVTKVAPIPWKVEEAMRRAWKAV